MRWLWSPDGDGRVLPRARRPYPHRDSFAGSACRRRLVYRAPVSKRVVVEHPVVVGGQGSIGTSHEIVVCQTAPELLFCRRGVSRPGDPAGRQNDGVPRGAWGGAPMTAPASARRPDRTGI